MPRHQLDRADLVPKPVSRRLREAILKPILAWPYLEIGLAYWIGFALGVRASEAAILIGAMDTRNKIDKLRALYVHRKDKEAVALLKEITKEHGEHVKIRNTIAHAMLMGSSREDPDCAYFLTSRADPHEHGFMVVSRYSISSFEAAEEFALSRSMDICNLLRARGVEVE